MPKKLSFKLSFNNHSKMPSKLNSITELDLFAEEEKLTGKGNIQGLSDSVRPRKEIKGKGPLNQMLGIGILYLNGVPIPFYLANRQARILIWKTTTDFTYSVILELDSITNWYQYGNITRSLIIVSTFQFKKRLQGF